MDSPHLIPLGFRHSNVGATTKAVLKPVGSSQKLFQEQPTSHCNVEILQQPPETWYKDQYGRKATFQMKIKRIGKCCSGCLNQRHLAIRLLYENGRIVDQQNEILRVVSGLCLDMQDESILALRIMEVSKNHQNQKFRIHIALPTCPLTETQNSVTSNPILVLSKKNKRTEKPQITGNDDEISRAWKKLKSKESIGNEVKGISSQPQFPALSPSFNSDNIGPEYEWDDQIVQFKVPNAGLCLWANAAFNFLHKLQFQALQSNNTSMNNHMSIQPTYQCPMCQEKFNRVPKHSSECDLGFLLEQSRSSAAEEGKQNDVVMYTPAKETISRSYVESNVVQNTITPAKKKVNDFVTDNLQLPENNENSVINSQTNKVPLFPSNIRSISISNSLNGGSQSYLERSQSRIPSSVGSSLSLESLVKQFDLNSWNGYSEISKYLFSVENGDVVESTMPNNIPFQNHNVPAPISNLNGMSYKELHPSQVPIAGRSSKSSSLSKILSNIPEISPDTTAFLEAQDEQLNGDANLLCSFSRVSLSGLSGFLSNTGEDMDKEIETQPNGNLPSNSMSASSSHQFNGISAPLSLPTNGSVENIAIIKVRPNEEAVHYIVASDFRHCGYPAFDKKFELLGFYYLSETDLIFMPNFYKLPPAMLAELEEMIPIWKNESGIIYSCGTDRTIKDIKQIVFATSKQTALT